MLIDKTYEGFLKHSCKIHILKKPCMNFKIFLHKSDLFYFSVISEVPFTLLTLTILHPSLSSCILTPVPQIKVRVIGWWQEQKDGSRVATGSQHYLCTQGLPGSCLPGAGLASATLVTSHLTSTERPKEVGVTVYLSQMSKLWHSMVRSLGHEHRANTRWSEERNTAPIQVPGPSWLKYFLSFFELKPELGPSPCIHKIGFEENS